MVRIIDLKSRIIILKMQNIIINTCPHSFKDKFDYHIIDKNNILIERTDERLGWWFELNIEILNVETGETRYVNIGINPSSYYKMKTIDFDLYEPEIFNEFETNEDVSCRNGKIFDSMHVKDTDIELNSEDTLVVISGIIYVSNVKLDGNLNRSGISSDDRYNQTLQSIKNVCLYIPGAKIILLEQSKEFPENKITELSKYCDYIIQYKNDEQNDYYSNIQSFNKGLGEMYVTQHFCNVIKDKKFKLFCKMVGRYIITSKFNINDFLDFPTFKVIKGDGRLNIMVHASFYSIQLKYFNAYIEHQKIWLSRDRKEPIEHILTMFVESLPEMKLINKLNMHGFLGISNEHCYL
jgi:hypothetical protein